MKARNVTTHDIIDIVSTLSREKYNYNVVIERIAQETSTTVSFKIGVSDSRGEGSRHSWQGRHGKYACTHVFEDIMREVIAKGGYVPIGKGMPGNTAGHTIRLESERELDRWVDMYNSTNIGSLFQEAYPEQLCNVC